jgi:hypothetical protein
MPLLRKDQLATAIANEESLATTLLVACLDNFGTAFFEWEPDALDLELRGAFGVEMPTENRDKLWALVTAITTNLFYVSLESFIPICNSLNGTEANFQYYDPVTGEEAAWAITEVLLSDPPVDEDPADRFSHEIKHYIGLTLKSEGITTPPRILAPYAAYDDTLEDRAGAVIGPDESMLKMYSDRQTREKEEIEQYVNERLDQLGAQLQQLPLAHGDTSGLLDHLRQARTGATGKSPPAEPELSVLPSL